jgi:hypothetical protein
MKPTKAFSVSAPWQIAKSTKMLTSVNLETTNDTGSIKRHIKPLSMRKVMPTLPPDRMVKYELLLNA